MRTGGLFFGYGGLELAIHHALGGGELAWVADIDPGARKLIDHRYPGLPNIGDVTAVDWSAVEPVDVLAGGSPCQDLSTAGRRAGMTEGTRSNLWVAMREAIAQLRPPLVVWENVRGAYSAPADSTMVDGARPLAPTGRGVPALRALGRVLGDLSDLGYDAVWHGLPASAVGAPHGRPRVFVVAYRDADGLELLRRQHAPNRHPDRRRGPDRPGTPTQPPALLGTPRASEWKGAGPVGSKSHRHRLDRDYLDAQVVELAAGPTRWGKYAAAVAQWETLTRPAPDPTETGPKGNPRLSPAFDEWLMGLPAGWITDVPGITWTEALKLCGNGVVPQQAAAAIKGIRRSLLEAAA